MELRFFLLTVSTVVCLEENVYVEEGTKATLVCPSISEKVPTTWFSVNEGSPISEGENFYRHLTNNGKFQITGNHSVGEYNLQIKDVTFSDEGSYRCIVVTNSKTYQHEVRLFIKVKPTNLRINGAGDGVLKGSEGELLNLLCSVKSGVPNEHLEWIQNGTVLSAGGPETLRYELMPRRSDHLEFYSCLVNSSALNEPLIETVQLKIKYRPYVYFLGGNNTEISERQPLSVVCNADSNPTAHRFVWIKISNTNKQIMHNDRRLYFEFVTRRDEGTYKCEATNSVGIGSNLFDVIVQYPPKVIIEYTNYTTGDNLRVFRCNASGIPDKYIFYDWEHKSEFGEHIRYLIGTDEGTLLLPNIGYEGERYGDSGYYSCYVSNGQIDINGTVKQSSTVYLSIEGKPYFLHDKKVYFAVPGETIEIVLSLMSNPKYYDFDMENFDEISDEEAVFQQTIYNSSIQVRGYRMRIKILKWFGKGRKNYSVTVTNAYGDVKENIFIVSASEPGSPLNFSAYSLNNDVIIAWISNFNGGLTQDFVIEYRAKLETTWASVHVMQSDSEKISWKISGLEEDETYVFRMYASNKIGQSNKTEIVEVHISGKPNDFVIATTGGSAFLLIILSGIFLYIRYHTKRFPASHTEVPQPSLDTAQESYYEEIEENYVVPDQHSTLMHVGVLREESLSGSNNSVESNQKPPVCISTADNDNYLTPYTSLTENQLEMSGNPNSVTDTKMCELPSDSKSNC